MALITCKECGKEISETAASCPQCGYARAVTAEASKHRASVFAVLSSVILVLTLFTPKLILVIPVAATVILAAVSALRRERLRPLAIIVGAIACALFVFALPSAAPGTSAQASIDGASACPATSFTVSKLNAYFEYGFMHVTGKIHNSCDGAYGVQLKWTAYNTDGTVAFSDEFWPASTSNIPPSSDYPFESLNRAPTIHAGARYTVEAISSRQW